jgi:hypothetical protein
MRAAALRRAIALAAIAVSTGAWGADALGTLFTTPDERARLDQLRRGEPVAAEPLSRSHEPRITGFVKRSDGRGTVWIDGLAVPVRSREAERLLDTAAVRGYADRGDDQVRIERKKSP